MSDREAMKANCDMNPIGLEPSESSRPPLQSSPLSPLAPPFEPRDQSSPRTTQHQFESGQQPMQEGLNTNDTIQASRHLTCPLNLSLVPKVKNLPNNSQTQLQPETPFSNNHFVNPQSDQNTGRNAVTPESLSLHGPMQGSFPLFLPPNQAPMPSGHFLAYHPGGVPLSYNQTSYSQDHNIAQNIFVPDGFNPHGAVSGLLLRPVDQALLAHSGNLYQNLYHPQSRVLLSNNQTVHSRFDYECAPKTFACVGMNPQVTTQASGPLALPFGVHLTNNRFTHPLSDQNLVNNTNYFAPRDVNPSGIMKANGSLTCTVNHAPLSTPSEDQDCNSEIGHSHQLRNHSDLPEWPVILNSSHSYSMANLYPSIHMSPPSALSMEHQSCDLPPQLDAIQTGPMPIDKKYADESDVPLCDLHFYNLFWQLPKRLIKGRGTTCFVCLMNAKVGIVISGAGEMSGERDELEGACALPLMSAHQYDVQFPSLLPSSEHHRKKSKPKKIEFNENELTDQKVKAGTCNAKDGPESQKGRNDQERPDASKGTKLWKPQPKAIQDQKQPPLTDEDFNSK